MLVPPPKIIVVWAVLILLLCFIGFWYLIIWAVALFGGWRKLALRFPAQTPPTGTTFTWQSLQIKPCTNYSGSINVTLSPGGIYLVPVALFQFGHSPMLIPWDRVVSVRFQRVLFWQFYAVSIRTEAGDAELTLPRSAQASLRDYGPL